MKKYALKHFLFVGILFGFIVGQILTAIINQPIGMFLYFGHVVEADNIVNALILSASAYLIILFSIYIGNIVFAKIIHSTAIPSSQLLKSASLFFLFVLVFLTWNNGVPAMIDEYMSCLSTPCRAANPSVLNIPFFFLLYVFRVIAIPLGFLFISAKYFNKQRNTIVA